ncbi:MAG: hypothetical protein U0X87_14535 [Anaerolineales bacterium]
MPIFKVALAVLIGFLPLNFLRVLAYRLLFGYRITLVPNRIWAIIAVDEFAITKSRINYFNQFIGPMKINIAEGASIRDRNTFSCGYWVLREENRTLNYTRTLEIGADTLITSGHHFDVAGKFKLGDRSWIAGIGSQFWTHGVGVLDRNIEIGSDCYLGSAVRFAPGAAIANNVLVAMGSVVSGKIDASNALIGGVPAKVLRKNYDWKSQGE